MTEIPATTGGWTGALRRRLVRTLPPENFPNQP